jgi:hypothetical protein
MPARRFAVASALLLAPAVGRAADAPVDFNRQVRPLLADHCFSCHGPDDRQRKAELRLDTKDGVLGQRPDSDPVVVPGKSADSELIRRVTSAEPSKRMPPAKTGKPLTAAQIDTLKRWVDQGAKWSDHWAFIPPVRPVLPAVKAAWGRNAIDRFVLARLEAEGLTPSPEADKTTLIRRLTLDLTGLPPTPQEVDAFLKDESANAYEKLVDRLLASPRYGERMALDWLDSARFADTHGYHIDSGRDMTRWRDWVIDSFNANKRFDEFSVEQIAGDLLPNATLPQKIASGFNRNHMINFEGGAVPEEYHTAYIVDRVNTTATVWMGLTLGCAQCHDHKFDPVSQREYYRLFAFFHNVPENGLDGSKGNAAPLLKAPTDAQRRRLDEITSAVADLDKRIDGPMPAADAAQAEWEKTAATQAVAWTHLDPREFTSKGGAKLAKLDDKSIRATGTNPARETYTVTVKPEKAGATAFRLEVLPDDGLNARGPGRSDNGNIVLTEVQASEGGKTVKLTSASADFSQDNFPASAAIDGKPNTGWAILPEVGKPHAAVFAFEQPLGDGPLTVTLQFQSQFAGHHPGRFRLSVTNAAQPHGAAALPDEVVKALAIPAEKRTDAQNMAVRSYYRRSVSADAKSLADELAKLRRERTDIEAKMPTTMVMAEMPKPRDTFVLVRGQYDKKGEKVTAGTPEKLPPLAKDASPNRLGLAQWLVAPGHPLTARVAVNRYWQIYFGRGLVATPEDFGSQGSPPSHPELLDWLATEFVHTGWDVKAMQRLIVTSAAYRQSSKATPALLSRDPENVLLARQSRLRLQAEFIRDLALSVSGLLNGEVGGASVSPYQPSGLWEELMSRGDGANWTAQTYTQSHGKDLYRRGMYTFWKRTSPPPSLGTFDAPDREVCTVRRSRTNTPLQALVLMNDPTYVEASRKLAERLMSEGGATPEGRITLAFRLATARTPSEKEIAVVKRVYAAQLASYRKDPAAALKLLGVGESKRDEKLDAAELAAWAAVAGVILNLDETITRG